MCKLLLWQEHLHPEDATCLLACTTSFRMTPDTFNLLRHVMRAISWWTFRYFLFFLRGGGKGESEAPGGGGGRFFIENPRRGGSPRRVGAGGARGQEGVCEKCGGGGAKYFFSGPKFPPRILSVRPNCSHRCVSLKENPLLQPVQILKHTTENSAEQTSREGSPQAKPPT